MIARRALRLLVPFLVASATALLPVARAGADTSASVTLEVSPSTVSYGETVTLSGTISPGSAGEHVTVEDAAGAVVADTSTDASGGYSAEFAPEANVVLHAVWNAAESPPVDVGVRAVVAARLGKVRLFGKAVVSGTVAPAVPGGEVTIALVQHGKIVESRDVSMRSQGDFRGRLAVSEPGKYHARATFVDADHLKDTDVAGPETTPLPALHIGSSGTFVRLLEHRLVDLHYRLEGVNGSFDGRTGDAVIAFHKVQGMARVTSVDAGTWKALADPSTPRAHDRGRGFHIEVDQSRQVLYTVEDGEVTNILHVSSGKPSTPTPDGSYHVFRKLAGYSGGGLYYPSYFNGGRAIHGWPDVPTYAASHGCVRVPFWNAQWIFGLAKLGTLVLIYH